MQEALNRGLNIQIGEGIFLYLLHARKRKKVEKKTNCATL